MQRQRLAVLRAPAVAVASLALAACGTDSSPADADDQAGVATPVTSPDTESTGSAPSSPAADLGRPLDLWIDGQQDAAIDALADADFSAPNAAFDRAVLTMSESEFADLSADRRAVLQQEAQQVGRAFRELARAAADRAALLAAEGDTARARTIARNIEALGQTLAAADKLAIMQLIGDAIQTLGQETVARVGVN
jgi:hypothetical protein